MKISRTIIAAGMALCIGVAGAQELPQRPVLEAAKNASPTARVRAFHHVQQGYPGIAKQVHSELKARYPKLEEHLIDSALATWEKHPGHLMAIREEIEARHGDEITQLKKDVRTELEANYPNFRTRLKAVLDEKGIQSRHLAFLIEVDPGLISHVQGELSQEYPALADWRPGMFRQMRWNAEPGSHPLRERWLAFLQGDPSRGPALARKMVNLVRERSPGLASEYAVHWLDHRRELIEALQDEFPGAGEKIATLIEEKHPELRKSVQQLVENQGEPMRKTLRSELNTRMPGFEKAVLGIVEGNYPNLRRELLDILRA